MSTHLSRRRKQELRGIFFTMINNVQRRLVQSWEQQTNKRNCHKQQTLPRTWAWQMMAPVKIFMTESSMFFVTPYFYEEPNMNTMAR